MATRVGKLHAHELPDENTVPYMEVYRCECQKEFFRGQTDKDNTPTWVPLEAATHYVEYDVDDSPLIGRYIPEVPGVPRPKNSEEQEQDVVVLVPELQSE